MEKPRDDTSARDLIERGTFTIAGVAADPVAGGKEAGLAAAQTALEQSARAAEDLDDERVRRRAVLLVHDRDLDRAVRAFELDLYGLVSKNRHDSLYIRYFPEGLRAVTEAEMRRAEPAAVEVMIKAMGEDASTPGIGPIAMEHAPILGQRLSALRTAEVALVETESQLAYLRTKSIPAQRAAWVDEYVELRGALEALFPRDAQRVEGFFSPFRKERKKGAAEPETPALAKPEPAPGGGSSPAAP